jgi:hypothetical protein
MANDTLLNTPTLWINNYIKDKLSDYGFDGIPFFPSTPSTIDDITETLTENGIMATYDRLFRMNKKSFPHIKCEQMLYYFYATQSTVTENLVQVTEGVQRLLDRGDESAQEVNDWCSNRQINLGTSLSQNLIDNIFYFHTFKVYQLEETRDIIDFGTARTYGGNKIIVEFDYHVAEKTGVVNSSLWKPEPKPATKIIIGPK